MENHVEKSKEDPIPTRKLLMMVNDYVVNSTRFVNRFHAVTEEKLQNVSKRIGQTVTSDRTTFSRHIEPDGSMTAHKNRPHLIAF